jgi:hypothetical protein
MTDNPFPKSSALIADAIRDEMIRLMSGLLKDAVEYERAAFEDPDAEINGANLVEWFSMWRAEVQVALAEMPLPDDKSG